MKQSNDIHFRWQKTKVHFGVIAAAMVFILALLAKETRFHELHAELMRSEREFRNVQEERDNLVLELEHYRTPGRVRAAATEMGLVTPDLTRVRQLETR